MEGTGLAGRREWEDLAKEDLEEGLVGHRVDLEGDLVEQQEGLDEELAPTEEGRELLVDLLKTQDSECQTLDPEGRSKRRSRNGTQALDPEV